MVKKYTYGSPFYTGAVIEDIKAEISAIPYFEVSSDDGISFEFKMHNKDIVYGLGEATRGINKRGYVYNSYCSDDFCHMETTRSLYGAHNFILIEGEKTFGAFFDYPTKITFDIGYTKADTLKVYCDKADIDVYIIEGETPIEIVKSFRKIIGKSYVPPRWAMGYMQSRWSYYTSDAVREVARNYRKEGIPLDAIFLDIDYMEKYKDFTVSSERFGDLPELIAEMKEEGIRLVPIIDAGVKIEEGYDVYEEGLEKGYFCVDKDGKPFSAGVWPGLTHFPDFLNEEAGLWFGLKYKALTDLGIDGFWNDMNEPAIFYSEKGIERFYEKLSEITNGDKSVENYNKIKDIVNSLQNSQEDYNSIYHNVDGKLVKHNDIHNMYGYKMTECTAKALEKIRPHERTLLFSRASYVGMHRSAGIWTGDNFSWWSHILLELKQLPALNMCGFLYVGADLGGFGCDATRDLVLRWLGLGIFTPLMRNHAALCTRDQECYQFENPEDFKNIIELRYRLLPYLYSEFLKCAENNEMFFKPLGFEFNDDEMARNCEDQLFVGNELMIAPVYTQNAIGRYVYLPEDMKAVRLKENGKLEFEDMAKGHHFVEIPLNEVVFFLRKGKCIPLAKSALSTDAMDFDALELIGYEGAKYELYTDDGINSDLTKVEKKILNN